MSDDEGEYSMRHEDSDVGEDSVGEDAELELSCALQDLALRVKTFEENMKGRFRDANGDDEIDEDIPETDVYVPAAVPEAGPKHHRRRKDAKRLSRKAARKQQEDEEDEAEEEGDDPYENDEFSGDESGESDAEEAKGERGGDWDYQEQTEELSELKHNIAMLLRGFKAEATALERGGEDNQAK